MKKKNPKSSDVDSFKYSILTSLHSCDIPFHLERISKLKQYECLYDFNEITPDRFEINNSKISPIIFNDSGKKLYTSNNNGIYNVNIVETGNRYAAVKLLKNKHTLLKEVLQLSSHEELKEIVTSKIKTV